MTTRPLFALGADPEGLLTGVEQTTYKAHRGRFYTPATSCAAQELQSTLCANGGYEWIKERDGLEARRVTDVTSDLWLHWLAGGQCR